MWFKNLTPYRLTGFETTAHALEEALASRPLQEIGSQDMVTRGWVPVYPHGPLVMAIQGHYLIALGITTRNLPGSAVNEVAAKKADEIEQAQGFKPNRTQMREIKEAVLRELLPHALPRTRKLFAWIDPAGGLLGIDTPSVAHAETLLDALRDTLDALPVKMVKTELAPVTLMTGWLAANEATGHFTIDQDCELRATAQDNARIRYVNKPLDGPEIQAHLAAGMLPTRLALTFDDRLSFVLTDKLQIKRLTFLGAIKEEADRQAESAHTQSEADFALMSGELARLMPALFEALGGLITEEAQ